MRLDYELLNGNCVQAYNNYYQAEKEAIKKGLKLAEYGDIYGEEISYCIWNKSGDRNDDEEIICYYTFIHGKPIPLDRITFESKIYN